MRALRTLAAFAAVAFLSALSACRSQSSSEAAKKAVDTFTSWAATTHLIADRWLAHAIPDKFAAKSLQQVEQTLRKELKKSASQGIPPHVRAELSFAANTVDSVAGAIQSAIEHGDRPAVARQFGRLSKAQQSLAELRKRERST
jgi:hypothetical protein